MQVFFLKTCSLIPYKIKSAEPNPNYNLVWAFPQKQGEVYPFKLQFVWFSLLYSHWSFEVFRFCAFNWYNDLWSDWLRMHYEGGCKLIGWFRLWDGPELALSAIDKSNILGFLDSIWDLFQRWEEKTNLFYSVIRSVFNGAISWVVIWLRLGGNTTICLR